MSTTRSGSHYLEEELELATRKANKWRNKAQRMKSILESAGYVVDVDFGTVRTPFSLAPMNAYELKGEEQPRFGSREPSPRNLFSEDGQRKRGRSDQSPGDFEGASMARKRSADSSPNGSRLTRSPGDYYTASNLGLIEEDPSGSPKTSTLPRRHSSSSLPTYGTYRQIPQISPRTPTSYSLPPSPLGARNGATILESPNLARPSNPAVTTCQFYSQSDLKPSRRPLEPIIQSNFEMHVATPEPHPQPPQSQFMHGNGSNHQYPQQNHQPRHHQLPQHQQLPQHPHQSILQVQQPQVQTLHGQHQQPVVQLQQYQQNQNQYPQQQYQQPPHQDMNLQKGYQQAHQNQCQPQNQTQHQIPQQVPLQYQMPVQQSHIQPHALTEQHQSPQPLQYPQHPQLPQPPQHMHSQLPQQNGNNMQGQRKSEPLSTFQHVPVSNPVHNGHPQQMTWPQETMFYQPQTVYVKPEQSPTPKTPQQPTTQPPVTQTPQQANLNSLGLGVPPFTTEETLESEMDELFSPVFQINLDDLGFNPEDMVLSMTDPSFTSQ